MWLMMTGNCNSEKMNTVLHQVLNVAVDDKYIRSNPSDEVLKELKKSHVFKTEKKRGLTVPEEKLFLNFLQNNPTYSHWYPIFAVMLGTGMRVGEVTGLRWSDIDLDNRVIDINHTLVYYCHRQEAAFLILPATHSDIHSLPVCAKLGSMSKSFRILWDIRIYQLL